MLFFSHIPKAGGETLKRLFYNAYGIDKCIKVWNPLFGADISPSEVKRLTSDEVEKNEVILGHLNVSGFLENEALASKYQKGDVTIIASVRDPIDRIISLYNYMRVNKNHPKHKEMLNVDAHEFIFEQKSNFQFRFLSCSEKGDMELPRNIHIFNMDNSVGKLKKFLEGQVGKSINAPPVLNKTKSFQSDIQLISRDILSSSEEKHLVEKHYKDYELLRGCDANQP